MNGASPNMNVVVQSLAVEGRYLREEKILLAQSAVCFLNCTRNSGQS